MIISQSIVDNFSNNIKLVKVLGEKVTETLRNYCQKNEYPFIYRYKTLESLSEKIESGRFNTFEEINDLYACTIIIPNLNLEDQVINDVKALFNVSSVKIRGGTKKPPDVFRFDSTRLYANLFDYTNSNPLAKIGFEIQIKSAFEYAWSITTHSLTYKTNIPSWKRQRIASQLKASVEQLDTIVLGFEQLSLQIKESRYDEYSDRLIIYNFMMRMFNDKTLPSELFPKDLNNFCDNILQLLRSVKWYKNNRNNDKLAFIILHLEYAFNNLVHIPRSISLFQLIFCLLVQRKFVSPPLFGFTPLITEEMKKLFPEIEVFKTSFTLS